MPETSLILHRTDGRVLESFARDWSLDWRHDNVQNLTIYNDMHARRVTLETDEIHGSCEFARLEDGLYLSLLNLALPTGFSTKVTGEDLVEFNFRFSGDMHLSGQWGDVRVDRPSTLIWYQPEGHDDVWEELGGPRERKELSLTLYCAKWWLRNLVNGQSDVSTALERLLSNGNGTPSYRVLSISAGSAETARHILNNTETGPLRMLFLKAKGYELLANTLRSFADAPQASGTGRYFTLQDRENISEAKRILEEEFASPPPLATLARRVGLNETKLNLGLRQLYGISAQEIIRERRFEHAVQLLTSTDLPVSEVGYRVGYAHHSTFTAAFVERFGMSPKRFALSRRQDKLN